MLDLLLQDAVFVVFDVETTGLSAFSGDKICEIAAMKIKGKEIIEHFYSLVNPQRPIGEGAFRIHGITIDLLSNAPTIEDILPDFLKFIKNTVLVAYNADFDISFINAALLQQNQPRLTNRAIDLLNMARRLMPGMPRYNLGSIARAIGVSFANSHRARIDCELANKIFLYFIERMERNTRK
ncbi:MAG: 3'-5' exonuclease [Candidatus Omnitrophota bacterium]